MRPYRVPYGPRGEKFRIVEIRTELLPEMLDAGFNGVVEPA